MESPSHSPFPSDNPRVVSPMTGDAHRMHRVAPLQPAPESSGIAMGDIYYTLFRHKWKIVLCAVAGLALALASRLLLPSHYESEARLFIRYVMESQGLAQPGEDGNIRKSPDQRGETIINSEIEILTSMDLAEQVAKTIGPEKLLKKLNGINDLNRAALLIQRGLVVEVARNSSVIRIVFSHTDPAVVQPVLSEIIDLYRKRHVEIHHASGLVGGFLAAETDQLRTRLAQTEEELRKARNKAGVINLNDSKKTYGDVIARIRQEIFTAQVELAERSAMLQVVTKQPSATTPPTGPAPADATAEPSAEQVKQYRNIIARLDSLQKREQDLLTYFREDNPRVKDIHTQLAEAEALKKNLEDAFPKLARVFIPVSNPAGGINAPLDIATERARLTALETKIKVLNSQLEATRAEAANTDQNEATILQLMRQKELEEANYKNYSASLEQARINDALGAGSVSNISEVQSPSPPLADFKKPLQIMGALAAAGLFGGLAWAFLRELYFDRSVRRPVDVERMLHLPLFLSIPNLSTKELGQGAPAPALPAPAKDGKSSGTELSPWSGEPALYPFHETLRDRLIGYFENKGLTHKPKLVAVTGIGHNGGVTTTAAGLASSLSETGDGNVLLVDMTTSQGSAQQFYGGKAVCGLEEILDTRDSAQIEGNLYVVGQEPGGEKLSRILPHRFNKLVPKLKASNFDYIIFDMPPVSQISITPRLAGFMDMVLLVIESEKTDRDLVQRATAMLAESKAHVGAVLNKTKTYVPLRLHQESLGNS